MGELEQSNYQLQAVLEKLPSFRYTCMHNLVCYFSMNKTVTFKIRANLDIVLLKCLPISEYILSMDKSK